MRHSSKLYLSRKSAQAGAALILLVFTLSLVMVAYVFRALNADTLRARQDVKTMQTLAEAKAALLAWAVNNNNQPGLMPFPDRNGDGIYDGKSDCDTSNLDGNYDKLLGQLPWLAADDANCSVLVSGMGQEFKDGSGEHLWYAVSRNLVYNYAGSSYPVINPSIISSPTYTWMTVLDKNGNTISNRVAAVIIAPDSPNADQDRSDDAPPPTKYLDKFYIGSSLYSNTGYSLPDEDWVIGEDARGVSSSNTTYQQPYYFNDKLVYITIDELMVELEKRVAGEARSALNTYKATNGVFPFAAALGSTTNANQCVDANLSGLLPIVAPQDYLCTCKYSASNNRNCTCGFSTAKQVSYVLNSFSGTNGYATSGTFKPSGSCSATSSTCTCWGAGSCYRNNTSGTLRFSCDACGLCRGRVSGTFKFSTNGTFKSSPSGCSLASNVISCIVSSASTTYQFYLNACSQPPLSLPAWFNINKWQDYMYYTGAGGITVGSKTGISALLISSGYPITTLPYPSSKNNNNPQASSRPTCDITDYLDSTENSDANNVYDVVNRQRTSSYNDQMFIVAP